MCLLGQPSPLPHAHPKLLWGYGTLVSRRLTGAQVLTHILFIWDTKALSYALSWSR